MDARPLRFVLALGAGLWFAPFASAAEYKTANFVAHAPTPEFAKEVAFTAEQWRKRLAKEWLGKELPKWNKPCPIQVNVGQIGAGGATTFNFDRGEVYGWRMNVQGTRERILDSVIPHEVSHTIFATHFRRPLPRWADEGAATLAEHESEQRRQDLHLKQVWGNSRIPLRSLLSMKEYPTEMSEVMTLYAEGYSLADYFVQKRGRANYLAFLDEAEQKGWETALREHYGIEGIESLESRWGEWVLAGSPDLPAEGGTLLAAAGRKPADPEKTIRAQNEDAEPAAVAGAGWPERPKVFKTADAGDVEEFLPPQRTKVAARGAGMAVASGKEPRPAPLDGSRERRPVAATETADARPENGRRSLPRTARVEPGREVEEDFFDTTKASGSRRLAGAR